MIVVLCAAMPNIGIQIANTIAAEYAHTEAMRREVGRYSIDLKTISYKTRNTNLKTCFLLSKNYKSSTIVNRQCNLDRVRPLTSFYYCDSMSDARPINSKIAQSRAAKYRNCA